jgi:tetraacyldisaccharide 4'-kinase
MSIEKFFTDQYYKQANLIWLLVPFSLINYFLYYLITWLYKLNIFKQKKLPVTTIVIGNIIVGGSGKTQLVIYLAKLLKKNNVNVGIISRGYKGNFKNTTEVFGNSNPVDVGDEALLLKQKLNIPVFISKSRFEAGNALIKKYSDTDVIISDDGLQHKSLIFDYKILINDDRYVTNHLLLPAGPFREPLSKILDNDILVLSNSLESKKDFFNFSLNNKVTNLKTNKKIALNKLPNLHLSVGIGNPYRLINSLKKLCHFKYRIYDDHYYFTNNDFKDNFNYLITEKDSVKCTNIKNKNIWVLKSDARMCPVFEKKLLGKILDG